MSKMHALLVLVLLSACSDAGSDNSADNIEVVGQEAPRPGRPAPAEVHGQQFVSAVLGRFDFLLESAQVAEQKAGSAKTKAFAGKLRTDIAAAQSDLTQLATSGGLKPDPTPGETDQTDLAVLSSTSGAPLDRVFAESQMEALTQLVGLVRAYGDGGDNPALKTWAARSQTVLNERLLDVQSLKAEIEEASLPADQR